MKFERDGSGLISGLVQAEGLIDIPESTGDVHVGDLPGFHSVRGIRALEHLARAAEDR